MEMKITSENNKGQEIDFTRPGLYKWNNLDKMWKPCKKNPCKRIITAEFTEEDVN